MNDIKAITNNPRAFVTNAMAEPVCALPKLWKDSINQIIINEGYTKYEIENKSISTNGGNYIGVLNIVNVKGNTKDGKKETHLFVKSILPNADQMKVVPVFEVYNTELFVYNDLSKVLKELQDYYNVPLHEQYKLAKSYAESHSESLILENLSVKGFKTYHRMDHVSLKFAELSIKMLAKFHSLGFVLKEKRSEYFDKNIAKKKYALVYGDDLKEFSKTARSIVLDQLEGEVNEKFKQLEMCFGKEYIKRCKEDKLVRTMCHGDYRPTNILTYFKDGEVTEIIPIDYQILHYGCPVNDFYYFLYNCTDREFRKNHLSHLQDLYHDTMKTFLEYFDMDVNSYLPKEKFLKLIDEKKEMGLFISVAFLPLAFAAEDDLPDITAAGAAISFKPDPKLKPRLRGNFEEFIEWGLL